MTTFDAPGRLSFKHDKRSPTEHEDKATASYDGDGRELKRVTDQCRILFEETCEWNGETAGYFPDQMKLLLDHGTPRFPRDPVPAPVLDPVPPF